MGVSPDVRALGLLVLVACSACASLSPVLAPTRPLRAGGVHLAAGSAYVAPVVAPELERAREAQGRLLSGSTDPTDRDAVTRGALAYANSPTGLAPMVLGRVGVGARTEIHAGFLSGRTLRLGARSMLWTDADEKWSFNLGGYLRGAVFPGLLETGLPSVQVQGAGLYGVDAIASLGRTSSDLYDLWIAIRAGYSHGEARMSVASSAPFDARMERIETGFTLGMRVGFGRIDTAMELTLLGEFSWLQGPSGNTFQATMGLVPAATLGVQF